MSRIDELQSEFEELVAKEGKRGITRRKRLAEKMLRIYLVEKETIELEGKAIHERAVKLGEMKKTHTERSTGLVEELIRAFGRGVIAVDGRKYTYGESVDGRLYIYPVPKQIGSSIDV